MSWATLYLAKLHADSVHMSGKEQALYLAQLQTHSVHMSVEELHCT